MKTQPAAMLNSAADAWASWMWPMAWHVSVLVLVVAALAWLLRGRSARLRYALWLLVPIRLLLPPTLALATGWGWWLLPSTDVVELPLAISTASMPPLARGGAETESAESNSFEQVLLDCPEPLVAVNVSPSVSSAVAPESPPPAPTAALSLPGWLFCGWLLGVGVLTLRLIRSCLCAAQLVRRAQGISLVHDAGQQSSAKSEAEIGAGELLESCRRRMGIHRAVRLCQLADAGVPMLIGLFRSTIVLPTGLDERLTSRELEAVLVHELQHVARHDALVHFVQSLLGVIYFFHPLVWLTNRMLNALREDACDEATVAVLEGRRRDYGAGIVKVAKLMSGPAPTMSLGIVESGGQVKRRLQRILDPRLPVGRRLSWSAFALLLPLAAVVLPVAARPGDSVDPRTNDVAAVDPSQSAPTDAADDDRPITIPGRVLDSAGKPVAGASVRLNRWDQDPPIDRQPLAETSTGADGRFEISYRKSQSGTDPGYPKWWKNVVVSASKTGYGPAWVRRSKKTPDGEPAELRLPVDDLPITGRLVDLEGQPLAGVEVVCGEILTPEGADLSAWIDAVQRDESAWDKSRLLRRSLRPDEAGLPRETVTDADGRFRLTGVGRERAINLVFLGPAVARAAVTVLTRKTEPFTENRFEMDPGRLEPFRIGYTHTVPIFGADFEFALAPTRPIEGIVRDAQTGEALPNVGIQSWHFDGVQGRAVRHLRTTSDADGRFRLIGMPKGTDNEIVAIPNDEQPYLMRVAKVPDGLGLEPARVEFELHRGIWITGHVTHATSGKPVPRAPLFYAPYLSNPYAQKLPEFAGGGVDGTDTYQDRYRTAADGSFRLVGLPGPAIVGVEDKDGVFSQGQGAGDIAAADSKGEFPTFRNPLKPGKEWPTAMREINPVEGVESVKLDFALAPTEKAEKSADNGLEMAEMNADPVRTKAAAGVSASDAAPADGPARQTNAEASATLPPQLAVVAGQITLADGKPAAAAHVAVIAKQIQPPRGGELFEGMQVLAQGTTDASGNYRLTFAGISSKTHLQADLIARTDGYAIACRSLSLDSPADQVSLTLAAEEPIRARLVDIEGQPAAGIRVWAIRVGTDASDDEPNGRAVSYRQDGRQLPAAWPAPVTSDKQGRFTLTGVAAGRGVRLAVEASQRFAPQWIALNADISSRRGGGNDATYQPQVQKVLPGEEAVLPLEPAQWVEGVVTYADTGRPAPHARLTIWATQQAPVRSFAGVAGRADAEGRYRICPHPGIRFAVNAYPPDGTPYLARKTREAPSETGGRAMQVNVALPRGVPVRGTVADAESGAPVARAAVQYVADELNNPNAKDNTLIDSVGRQLTQDDGRFQFIVPPGPGRLLVAPPPRHLTDETSDGELGRGPPRVQREYAHAIERIEPAPGADSLDLSISIQPAATVSGRLVDENGKKIDEVVVITRLRSSGMSLGGSGGCRYTLTRGGKFKLSALAPGQQYPVYFLDPGGHLGATQVITADSKDTTVVLKPCGQATAKLVDAKGQPGIGIAPPALHPVVAPDEFQHQSDLAAAEFGRLVANKDGVTDIDWANYLPGPRSDEQGRIVFSALIPGATYQLHSLTHQKVLKQFSVSSGEQLDLGTIDVTSDMRPEPLRSKAAADASASHATPADGPAKVAPADAKTDAAAPAADDPIKEFAGTVVDPSGKPVEGAELYLVFYVPQPTGLLTPTWQPLAATDASGTFRFSFSRTDPGAHPTEAEFRFGHLVAVKEGFGFAWSLAARFETSGKLLAAALARAKKLPPEQQKNQEQKLGAAGEPLQLVADDQPIRGRIVDVNGQPVRGARLTLVRVVSGIGDDLTAWREAAKQPQAYYNSAGQKTPMGVNGPQVRSLVQPAVTDDDGRFTLHGVGRQRIAELLVEGPAIETDMIFARTEAGEKIELARERRQIDSETHIYHPAELLYVAGPSVPIVGVVRGEKSKAPLAGITVKSQQRHGTRLSGSGADFVRAVTDSHGVYRLDGMPIGSDNRISAIAPHGDTPYFSKSEQVPTKPGKPLAADIDLLSGVWLEGRITDKQTGKGLAGRLEYFVGKDNPSHDLGRAIHADNRDSMRTGDDGHFRIVVFPGPGYVAFMADEHQDYPRAESVVQLDGSRRLVAGAMMKTGYVYLTPENFHVVAEIDPAVDGDGARLNLQLDGDQKAIGHVVDPAGKPLTGFAYSGKMARFGSWDRPDSDKFELDGYDPASPRSVYFAHAERDLAGSLTAQGKLPDDLVVRLEPAGKVRGRLVDSDGSPLARCEIVRWSPPLGDVEQTPWYHAVPVPPGAAGRSPGQNVTDDDGRFEIACLVPGIDYRLRAHDQPSGPAGLSKINGPLNVVIRLAPGEAKDLGDVRLADNETFTNAAKQAQHANQEPPPVRPRESVVVTGQISLPDGKPAAAAYVAVIAKQSQPPRGGEIFEGMEVLAQGTTDASGNYRLTFASISSKTHLQADLIARTDGYAMACQSLSLDAPAEEVSLRLAAEEPIRARLVDIEGQPAAGIRVWAIRVGTNSSDGKPKKSAVGYREDGQQLPAAWPAPVTSDKQGRFTLAGVAASSGVTLAVAASDRFAPQWIALNTDIDPHRGEGDATYRPSVQNAPPGEEVVLPLEPAQWFEGIVTYGDTGKPAARARLTIWATQANSQSYCGVAGRADAEGRYRICPRPGVRFAINAYPPDGAPYLARRTGDVAWETGDRAKQVNVTLPRGVLVQGTVAEAGTAAPVARAAVQYVAEELNNPNTKDGILTGSQVRQFTREDGRFQIVVPPGPGRLLVHGPQPRYLSKETSDGELSRGTPGGQRKYAHAVERIEPAAGAGPVELSISLQPGASVTGRLVDEKGKKIDEALVITRLKNSGWFLSWTGYLYLPTRGGSFELSGLAPGEQYPVYFLDPGRRLGATQVITADSKDTTVVFKPCGQASAKLVDAKGRPRVGIAPALHLIVTPGSWPVATSKTSSRIDALMHAVVTPDEFQYDLAAGKLGRLAADEDYVANIDRANYLPGPKSDEQGRIVFPALIPGATYELHSLIDQKLLKQFSVGSGEQLDLGVIATDP